MDYDETRCFSSTIIRLLQKDKKLKPFINQFPSLNSFKSIIEQRSFKGDREILKQVVSHQYQHISSQSSSLKNNISSLKENNTFTITTGHQLNIFTGPLYFIFKIITAINLAKKLKEEFPDQNFVPVYWMATEDHDFEEINHTYIGGKKISWKAQVSGATGRLNPKTIQQALNEYRGILGATANAEKLSEIVQQAYAEHQTLADATRFLVHAFFGEYGLVIVDADDLQLKKAFAPIIQQDIIEQNSFKLINQSSEKLAEIDIHVQVNPREINFFYLKDDLRERIVFEDGVYKVLDTEIEFTEPELKDEISIHPERFSPNVVMRPLYQEVVLPNLAYIGGGGELAYWLQLKSNFEFYKVDFPLLILRNSAMLADEKTKQKLDQLDFSFQEVFEGTETLKKRYVCGHSTHELNIQKEWIQIHHIFEALKERMQGIDPTLGPSTEAVEVRLKKAMDSLERKLMRAEKRNFAEAISSIERIKQTLFPGGGLQERKENFGSFYVKYGDDLIKTLVENLDPLAFQFTILY